MIITYHAFDRVTGSYIEPDGGLDPTCPVPYPSAQYALNAILAMFRLNAVHAGSTLSAYDVLRGDVEIFTLIDGRKHI